MIATDPLVPVGAEEFEQLRAAWPNAHRLTLAFRLGRDLDACRALLAGEAVDPARLDRRELSRASRMRVVRLDETALDAAAFAIGKAA